MKLQAENGEWVEDQERLKELAVHFYKDLFAGERAARQIPSWRHKFNPLPQEELEMLEKPVVEIKNAIFEMGPYKAPGPDGWSPIFFQTQWSIVGETVIRLVKETFERGTIPQLSDSTTADIYSTTANQLVQRSLQDYYKGNC